MNRTIVSTVKGVSSDVGGDVSIKYSELYCTYMKWQWWDLDGKKSGKGLLVS